MNLQKLDKGEQDPYDRCNKWMKGCRQHFGHPTLDEYIELMNLKEGVVDEYEGNTNGPINNYLDFFVNCPPVPTRRVIVVKEEKWIRMLNMLVITKEKMEAEKIAKLVEGDQQENVTKENGQDGEQNGASLEEWLGPIVGECYGVKQAVESNSSSSEGGSGLYDLLPMVVEEKSAPEPDLWMLDDPNVRYILDHICDDVPALYVTMGPKIPMNGKSVAMLRLEPWPKGKELFGREPVLQFAKQAEWYERNLNAMHCFYAQDVQGKAPFPPDKLRAGIHVVYGRHVRYERALVVTVFPMDIETGDPMKVCIYLIDQGTSLLVPTDSLHYLFKKFAFPARAVHLEIGVIRSQFISDAALYPFLSLGSKLWDGELTIRMNKETQQFMAYSSIIDEFQFPSGISEFLSIRKQHVYSRQEDTLEPQYGFVKDLFPGRETYVSTGSLFYTATNDTEYKITFVSKKAVHVIPKLMLPYLEELEQSLTEAFASSLRKPSEASSWKVGTPYLVKSKTFPNKIVRGEIVRIQGDGLVQVLLVDYAVQEAVVWDTQLRRIFPKEMELMVCATKAHLIFEGKSLTSQPGGAFELYDSIIVARCSVQGSSPSTVELNVQEIIKPSKCRSTSPETVFHFSNH